MDDVQRPLAADVVILERFKQELVPDEFPLGRHLRGVGVLVPLEALRSQRILLDRMAEVVRVGEVEVCRQIDGLKRSKCPSDAGC